jgi:hypothetical protein
MFPKFWSKTAAKSGVKYFRRFFMERYGERSDTANGLHQPAKFKSTIQLQLVSHPKIFDYLFKFLIIQILLIETYLIHEMILYGRRPRILDHISTVIIKPAEISVPDRPLTGGISEGGLRCIGKKYFGTPGLIELPTSIFSPATFTIFLIGFRSAVAGYFGAQE